MSDAEKKDDTTQETKTSPTQKVSPWPSMDEAFGMVKKLVKDTSTSVGEIYQDYKTKRVDKEAPAEATVATKAEVDTKESEDKS